MSTTSSRSREGRCLGFLSTRSTTLHHTSSSLSIHLVVTEANTKWAFGEHEAIQFRQSLLSVTRVRVSVMCKW